VKMKGLGPEYLKGYSLRPNGVKVRNAEMCLDSAASLSGTESSSGPQDWICSMGEILKWARPWQWLKCLETAVSSGFEIA
jgi:hypothetical protein